MRSTAIGIALLALLAPAAASAQGFHAGDHVVVGSTGDAGTVIEVGQQLADGGTMVKVHLDRLGPGFPTVGSWYDSMVSRLSVTGGGAPPAMERPRPLPAAPPPAGPVAPRRDPAIPNPPGTSASAAACQQLIRANYPPGGADQTITVDFLGFQMSAQRPYVATYANDRGGRGHTVSAAPIHARYTVLTHYDDPNAPDELRTYDAQYMCYRSAAGGGWVVEMVSRAPGGETATYIPKR